MPSVTMKKLTLGIKKIDATERKMIYSLTQNALPTSVYAFDSEETNGITLSTIVRVFPGINYSDGTGAVIITARDKDGVKFAQHQGKDDEPLDHVDFILAHDVATSGPVPNQPGRYYVDADKLLTGTLEIHESGALNLAAPKIQLIQEIVEDDVAREVVVQAIEFAASGTGLFRPSFSLAVGTESKEITDVVPDWTPPGPVCYGATADILLKHWDSGQVPEALAAFVAEDGSLDQRMKINLFTQSAVEKAKLVGAGNAGFAIFRRKDAAGSAGSAAQYTLLVTTSGGIIDPPWKAQFGIDGQQYSFAPEGYEAAADDAARAALLVTPIQDAMDVAYGSGQVVVSRSGAEITIAFQEVGQLHTHQDASDPTGNTFFFQTANDGEAVRKADITMGSGQLLVEAQGGANLNEVWTALEAQQSIDLPGAIEHYCSTPGPCMSCRIQRFTFSFDPGSNAPPPPGDMCTNVDLNKPGHPGVTVDMLLANDLDQVIGGISGTCPPAITDCSGCTGGGGPGGGGPGGGEGG